MILALLAAAAVSGGDCSSLEAVRDAWKPGIDAYQAHDMAKAKAVTDAVIAACGPSHLADFPRVMRAEIAVTEGDHDGALAALGPAERPATAPVGPYSSLIALRAWAGKKDAEGFGRERARLLAGSAAALSAPGNRFKGKLVETFDAGGVHVTALETDFQDGSFRRHYIFLLAPDEAFSMPGTIMLTTDPTANLLGGPPVWFVDEYSCGGHATLDIVERRKPDYKAMKAKVTARLAGKLSATSSIAGGGVCAFPNFVAPGFSSDEE